MNIFEVQFKKTWAKKFIIFLVSVLLLAVFWYAGIHSYLSSHLGKQYGEIYSILIAVALFIGVFITLKIWRIFTDRSFQGVITKIRHKETLASPKGDARPTATESRYHIYLSVLLENGKTVTKHIEHTELFYDDLWYRVGDYVTYHRGTKFPLVKNGRKICAYCGHELISDEDKCSNCGYTSEHPKINS